MSEHSRGLSNAGHRDRDARRPRADEAAAKETADNRSSAPISSNGGSPPTLTTPSLTAGVDEVGRGPLAGPVVAAAVILDPARPIRGLIDSKRLSAAARARLAREIRARAVAAALGAATEREIDTLNILEASLLAMERAVHRLALAPAHLLVDGRTLPRFADAPAGLTREAVVGGDASEPAISAASILAKDFRDRLMHRLHRRYPRYGFDRHKGYPTAVHIAALDAHGPCEIHRTSFGPVSRSLATR